VCVCVRAGAQESMKLMGMKGYLHWCAWMFKFSTSITICCVLMTAIFYVPTASGAIINHSDPLTIFLFLYLYAVAIVTFAFAASAAFSHSNLATLIVSVGGLGRLALARWAGWSGVQVGRHVEWGIRSHDLPR